MKKKGFTLVELLATIVVLSVIALIATPIILNVIEKAKKGALVSSVNGLVESANMYYTNEIIKGEKVEDVIFDFEEGIQTSTNKLSYKGKVYNGKLILTSNSDVITCIDDGKYYAYKEKDSDEVISGIGTCLYDGTTGDFTIESDVDVIIKECDEDKADLQKQIDTLTNQINNLQNEINEKEAAINSLQSNVEANQNEITTLEGEKQALQEALDVKNAELAKLNENLGKVTAGASDVLSGKTILGSDGELVTGTITSLAAKTYTPGKTNQTIASGQYLSGTQTIKGDANLLAANIKTGTSIFGVTGTYTSDANATASQILKDKTAYVNGSKVTGTMTNKAGTTTAATTVTESGDNAFITIPANGYYSTTSKISVPVETIKNNVTNLTNDLKLLAEKRSDANTGEDVNATADLTYTVDKKGMYVVSAGASKCASSGATTIYCQLNGTNQSAVSGFNGSAGGMSSTWILNCEEGDVIHVYARVASSTYTNAYACIVG